MAKGNPDAARNDTIVSLSKRRGFGYPSSEIYGGTRSAWDYGPLGVELKENVRRQWWKAMVQTRDDVVGTTLTPEEALSGAPASELGQFKVSSILGEEQ